MIETVEPLSLNDVALLIKELLRPIKRVKEGNVNFFVIALVGVPFLFVNVPFVLTEASLKGQAEGRFAPSQA